MTARVLVFTATAALSDLGLAAFARTDDPRYPFEATDAPAYQPCEVAILFGCLKPGGGDPVNRLRADILERHQGPLLMVESGYFGRRFRTPSLGRRLRSWLTGKPLRYRAVVPYWRVGLGGVFADDGDFASEGAGPERWQAVARQFGISVAPYRRTGRHILLAIDNQMKAERAGTWVLEVSRTIRTHTDRPILVRPHQNSGPAEISALQAVAAEVAGLTVEAFSPDLKRPFRDCWTVVCGRSGLSVDALLAGVPPICLSPQNPACSIASTSLAEVNAPREPVREPWLWQLAASQWTETEMADGAVWRRFEPKIAARLRGDAVSD